MSGFRWHLLRVHNRSASTGSARGVWHSNQADDSNRAIHSRPIGVSNLDAAYADIPERHVSRLADLPTYDIAALQEILTNRVQAEKRIWHSSGIMFEHGVTPGDGVACGIDHAHLHVLPVEEPSLSHVHDRVRRDYPQHATGTLEELLTAHSGTGSYLLYGRHAPDMGICHSASIQSQYMRKIIAEELGLESWDWRALMGQDAFRATADLLTELHPQLAAK